MKFIAEGIVNINGQDYDHVEIVDVCSYSTIDGQFVYKFRVQRNFNDHIYKLAEFENVVGANGISGKVRVHETNEIVPITDFYFTNGGFEGCTILNIGYPSLEQLPVFLTESTISTPQVHPINPFVAWWLPKGVRYMGKSLHDLGFKLDVTNYNF